DEVAGFRSEARAEIGVPLVLVLTEPDRATPFVADGVDGVPVALVRCAAPGEAEPLKGEVRPLAPVAASLLELEDDMTLSERQQRFKRSKVENRLRTLKVEDLTRVIGYAGGLGGILSSWPHQE